MLDGKIVLSPGRPVLSKEIQIFFFWLAFRDYCLLLSPPLSDEQLAVFVEKEREDYSSGIMQQGYLWGGWVSFVSYQVFILSVLWYLFPGDVTWDSVS